MSRMRAQTKPQRTVSAAFYIRSHNTMHVDTSAWGPITEGVAFWSWGRSEHLQTLRVCAALSPSSLYGERLSAFPQSIGHEPLKIHIYCAVVLIHLAFVLLP